MKIAKSKHCEVPCRIRGTWNYHVTVIQIYPNVPYMYKSSCFITDEEEPFLWMHWFDVNYEKIMITRAVTELAYQ